MSNIVLASDIVMDLNTSTNTNTDSSDETIDSTIYGGSTFSGDEATPTNTDSGVSVSNDYDVESSDELSVSNMINIVLIVVGIVLILLGIAIILKIK